MAIMAEVMSELGCRFGVLLPHLNERQRRLAVAVEPGCSVTVGFALWPRSPG